MNAKEYFFCYSKKLADYLNRNGADPITVADNPVSKSRFTLYRRDDDFERILDTYKHEK